MTQSSHYVCLACRLKQPLALARPSPVRSYATKKGAEETKSSTRDKSKKSLSSTKVAAKTSKPLSQQDSKDTSLSTRKASIKAPSKPTKPTVQARRKPPGKTISKTKSAKERRASETKAEGSLAREEENGGQADAVDTGETQKTRPRSRKTSSARSAAVKDSASKSVSPSEEDEVPESLLKAIVSAAGTERTRSQKRTPIRNALGKYQIRKIKSPHVRRLVKRLKLQSEGPKGIRKFISPNDLDPNLIKSEKERIARMDMEEEHHKSRGRPRKARDSKRRNLQQVSVSAVGIRLKDALKGGSLKEDHELPRMKAKEQSLDTIPIQQPPVPQLAHGLERVLFNPGIHHVRDPRTHTYNFDPHLEKLMPVREFNFDSLTMFTPPSRDENLAKIARDFSKKYVASTSSLTGTLKHFHYLLSQWRPINFNMLSKAFPVLLTSFTRLQRAPDAIFLRWKDGVYATDADKSYDSANVLSLMGRYMEKLLTVAKERFLRHKVGSPDPITDAERSEPEAFHYSTLGDFVLRSQLDASDPRLPGSSIFDLKTRAVVPIRMDSADYEWGMGYEIRSIAGEWQSFEREYHDMIRSTVLKYSLQVRMGRMDGIFVAFHNIARIFGFQYVSLEEMDHAIHGQWDRALGDQEFLLSLRLLNEIFNKTTEKFPKTSLRFHFEARPSSTEVPFMYVFAEPVDESKAEEIQGTNKHKIEEWERSMLHGAPTECGQDSTPTSKDELHSANEDAVAKAAYNVEQDVTSEFMAQADREDNEAASSGTLKDLRDKEYGGQHADAKSEEAKAHDETKPVDEGKGAQAPKEESAQGPLAAYVLTINNRVNGRPVTRPRNPFTEKDEWEVAYSLLSIDNPQRAWALYNMCKQRRHKEMGEDKKKARDMDYFKNLLKRVTEDGRTWRREVDAKEQQERDEGKGAKTLWDDKSHAPTNKEDEDKLGKRKGFSSWLFGR